MAEDALGRWAGAQWHAWALNGGLLVMRLDVPRLTKGLMCDHVRAMARCEGIHVVERRGVVSIIVQVERGGGIERGGQA